MYKVGFGNRLCELFLLVVFGRAVLSLWVVFLLFVGFVRDGGFAVFDDFCDVVLWLVLGFGLDLLRFAYAGG